MLEAFSVENMGHTVDQEIFTLKIICVKNVRVVKYSRFHSIHEIFFNG